MPRWGRREGEPLGRTERAATPPPGDRAGGGGGESGNAWAWLDPQPWGEVYSRCAIVKGREEQ